MSTAQDLGFGYNGAGLAHAWDLLAGAAAGTADRVPVLAAGELPLPSGLPHDGAGEHAALSTLAPLALDGATRLGDAGFFAHMDPPTPWITWATALWAASRNQNLLHPETSPVARQFERTAIEWLAPDFGMDGGHLVPGSSVANLTALWAARDLRGVRTVVCSQLAHLSIRKAAKILGLQVKEVGTDGEDRMRVEEAGDLSDSVLVLTAGTVASGAIDPLTGPHQAAWVHVDAAWAGPLRLSDVHRDLLEGVQQADSVSVSAHKWLFQPKESALVLFKDTTSAHEVLSFGGGYLAVPNVGVLGSHGAAALPLVAMLLAWGRQGIAQRIERCMGLADELAELIRAEDSLELLRAPVTGVVVWRPRGAMDLAELRARLRTSFVSITEIAGERWFRSVAANPMAEPQRIIGDVVQALSAR